MTVKQLIETLQQLDPELRVFTTGYESGLEDVSPQIKTVDVVLDYYNPEEWWYGPHEVTKNIDTTIDVSMHKMVKGIIL